MGDFSLLPSLVVLGVVLVALAAVSTVLRRRSRRRPAPDIAGAPARIPVDDLIRNANIQLVRMDDAIRSAEEELQFARVEFGEAATRDFADAVVTAKQRASEAFALKQKLDDHVPDTEQRQRDWSKRILSLTDSALAIVTSQSRAIQKQRRFEISAPDSLRRLDDAVRAGRDRVPAAVSTLATLRSAYDPAAYADVAGNPDDAAGAFADAERLTAEARLSLETDPLTPVAKTVESAEAALRRGSALLDAVERLRTALEAATTARRAALEAATAQLAEAARLRDTVEVPDAADRIVAASSRLDAAVRAATTRSPAHPSADVDALDLAAGALDETLAVARTAQQRLDSAREALVGAIRIAESHIATATDYIAARRGRVGSEARTRLASAERELALARLEADPVAALDAARRAATLATDADALARYDTLGH